MVVLTERDKMWLKALADGEQPKAFSGSSFQAVRKRLCKIRRSLGARTTTQAVAEALRRGEIK